MRADAQKNYDRLLATAREVFAEQGADASLRDIARRAQVGLGTLYRHFPSREALLQALLRTSFEALAARADALQTQDDSASALVSWLQETIAFTHERRDLIAALAWLREQPSHAARADRLFGVIAGAILV
ncbi:TetR/AcrR family transcriptional regulator [Pulveribacter suum]|uniref:TetR family transcriptional regulator n=1 Tax=Pulveribacter suum TaxID=2116657 RepID=A0A2P1NMM9_9BURK|nr:TetR/AcrR family transcriptional regulator [Pulveribacter suum]AVP58314.1 TetR family transcriptional regulator [Pulveribacter suum]